MRRFVSFSDKIERFWNNELSKSHIVKTLEGLSLKRAVNTQILGLVKGFYFKKSFNSVLYHNCRSEVFITIHRVHVVHWN